MKKLILLFAVLFSVKTVFGQGYKPVKIDSLVTVSMPAGYTQKDTLGQNIYSANTNFGYMMAIAEPNKKNNKPLKKANDLDKVFKDYVKGIQSQTPYSSAQNVRDTTVGALKAKAFTLVIDDGSGNVQNKNFLLIYTTGATYTFEYGYPDLRKDMVKGEAKAYFGSIKLSPDLQRNDQYMDLHSSSSTLSTNTVIEISGGILLAFGIVWIIFFRGRRNELA
ncbi:MAG TPA: hypothetical protein VHS53_04065 [Mucilaginibacter sp.]|jgi:hypothetical protein|nr:hypothetical protein [Mucilaginibacter sp.]